MEKKPHKLQIAESDRKELETFVSKGQLSERKAKRAKVLILAAIGKKPTEIALEVKVSLTTVYNIFNRYRTGSLSEALEERERSGQPRKVTPKVEAEITRMACSKAPTGCGRWTVHLLTEQVVALGYDVVDETVRLVLKKANVNLSSNAK